VENPVVMKITKVDNSRQAQLLLFIERFNPIIAYSIKGGLFQLQVALCWMV
jgi:hypothetical protein